MPVMLVLSELLIGWLTIATKCRKRVPVIVCMVCLCLSWSFSLLPEIAGVVNQAIEIVPS